MNRCVFSETLEKYTKSGDCSGASSAKVSGTFAVEDTRIPPLISWRYLTHVLYIDECSACRVLHSDICERALARWIKNKLYKAMIIICFSYREYLKEGQAQQKPSMRAKQRLRYVETGSSGGSALVGDGYGPLLQIVNRKGRF